MTAIFGILSLQLRNDTKMSPQLKNFFFIVASIVYGVIPLLIYSVPIIAVRLLQCCTCIAYQLGRKIIKTCF